MPTLRPKPDGTGSDSTEPTAHKTTRGTKSQENLNQQEDIQQSSSSSTDQDRKSHPEFPPALKELLKKKKAAASDAKRKSRKIAKLSIAEEEPDEPLDDSLYADSVLAIMPSDTALNGINGAPAAAGMNGSSSMPIHAGQQMDLNFLYSKVLELSEQLRENREQTQALIAGAEELAKRAAATGEATDVQEANSQLTTARIADLTFKLSEIESINKVLFREQRENGKLIGEYEQALEKVVSMLRDFAFSKEMEKSKLAKQYLHTLQTERDEHLKTRLERDAANTHILKLIGQMRHAYKLSCEESYPYIEVVAGLQNEVRSLRNLAGLPKEKFEEEFGYSVLKHVRGGAGEEDD